MSSYKLVTSFNGFLEFNLFYGLYIILLIFLEDVDNGKYNFSLVSSPELLITIIFSLSFWFFNFYYYYFCALFK